MDELIKMVGHYSVPIIVSSSLITLVALFINPTIKDGILLGINNVASESKGDSATRNLFSGLFEQGDLTTSPGDFFHKSHIRSTVPIPLKAGVTYVFKNDIPNTMNYTVDFVSNTKAPYVELAGGFGVKYQTEVTFTPTEDCYFICTIQYRNGSTIEPSAISGLHFQLYVKK